MEDPDLHLPPPVSDPNAHPQAIGPYRIRDVIGEGGMGVVYAAEQLEPVRRMVALKMMRPGIGSTEIIGRFEAERHALAVMDHPGIARVLDAGVTAEQRPYFVMELVRGIPIDQYCDRFRLTVRERLELFVALCEAVQHAHQKGVIHRDLKPSNVLVAEQDGKPTPKVIDFGIAKATGLHLSESPVLTSYGQAVGTLAYMSPEQAEGSDLDVDTRADVYSLGIMLYELIAGGLPIDPRESTVPAFLANLVSRDTPPPLPRDRVGRDTEFERQVAQARATDGFHLRKSLSGDLQWVVMKAIEKDRNRRYATANGLRLDLERFLDDRPVDARQPTALYRMGKFARRHKGAVAAAGIAAWVFVVGSVATSIGFIRAREAEAEARASQAQALVEATAAQQVTDFLVDLFEVSDPGEARGNTVTAREVLDRGAHRVEEELADQPVLQARMLATIGGVYRKLGLLDDAIVMLSRSVGLYEQELGPADGTVAQSLYELGITQRMRGGLDASRESLIRALAIQEAISGPDSDEAGHMVLALGGSYLAAGRLDEAEPLLLQAMEIEERNVAADHPQLATVVSDLGALSLYRGEYIGAAQYFTRAIRIRERQLGSDHPDVASVLNNLGAALYYQERYADARDAYDRARTIWEATLEPTHPRLATIKNNLAEVHWRLGEYAQAEPLFLEALSIKEQTLALENPSIATTLVGLANLYRDQGRAAEAEPRYRRAIQILEQALGPNHARLREPLEGYARLLRDTNRATEADALDRRIAGLGDG